MSASPVNMVPGATLDKEATNLFRVAEVIDLPFAGPTLCVPGGGFSVISRDDMVAIVALVPDGERPLERVALVCGMSAHDAHQTGAQLIAAAKEIGGDRGLQ